MGSKARASGLELTLEYLFFSIQSRDDPPAHPTAVAIPILAVLGRAALVVTTLAMHQQKRKIDRVEVGQQRSEPAGKRPGETQQPVTQIIRMARPTPKTRNEQAVAMPGLQEFGGLAPDLQAVRIAPKAVLLKIRQAK